MPAQPLNTEQKADAARLKAAFRRWQDQQKDANLPSSQEEAAARLGFKTQSALSQYVNGRIPLNAPALLKFCRLLGVNPVEVSPSIVREEQQRAMAWGAPLPAGNVIELPATHHAGGGLRKTAEQKGRGPATKRRGKTK